MFKIELYEFTLSNYDVHESRYFRKELLCAKDCGLVSGYTQGGGIKNRIYKASCDLLHSSGIKTIQNDMSVEDYLYETFPTKISIVTMKKMLDKQPLLRTKLGYSLSQVIKLVTHACQKMQTLGNKTIIPTSTLSQTLDAYIYGDIPKAKITQLNDRGFVLHLCTTDKIIAMGDIHGSYHTFWRNLKRLQAAKILESTSSLKIAPGYSIIFTGDIVDRGNYSIDVVLIILRMMVVNKAGTVIYNRGNHEDYDLNMAFGFYSEVEVKFGDILLQNDLQSLMELPEYANKNIQGQRTATHVLFQMQKFWTSCPCAVVVDNGKQRIWLSHGGIPIGKMLLSDSRRTEIINLRPEETHSCLWYDFFSGRNENPEVRGRKRIYPKEVINFMLVNKISFIIRGHQDSYTNSYILSTHQPTTYIDGSRFDLMYGYPQDHPLIYVSEQSTPQVFGPIARINVNDDWLSEEGIKWSTAEGNNLVWPVLTISTCTDLGRLLIKDSMVYIYTDDQDANGIKCTKIE